MVSTLESAYQPFNFAGVPHQRFSGSPAARAGRKANPFYHNIHSPILGTLLQLARRAAEPRLPAAAARGSYARSHHCICISTRTPQDTRDGNAASNNFSCPCHTMPAINRFGTGLGLNGLTKGKRKGTSSTDNGGKGQAQEEAHGVNG